MNDHISKNAFRGKNKESSEKRVQLNKKTLTSLITLTLISLLVSTPQMIFVASASSEPAMSTILDNCGFSNIELTTIETFPAGTYNITLLAEFAGYHRDNTLSYYLVETTDYTTIFTGPEGATGTSGGGYIVPPLSKMFEADNEFGLSMTTPYYQYFSEHDLNPDSPIKHCQVYKNLDDANMLLIGFENCYGETSDRDYNDMVFSLTLVNPLEILSVSRAPQTPNYDESVVVTSQVKQGSYGIDSVVLSYQVDSGSWINVTMNPDTTAYAATIPAQQYGKTVNYKVYASDTIGNTAVSADYSYVVGDFVDPIIIDVVQIPSAVDADQLVKILANVTEPADASGVKKVVVWFKTNSDDWSISGMSLDAGLWAGNLPGQKQGYPVQFYVEAFDNAGNSVESSVFSYTVVIPNSLPTAVFSVSPSTGFTNENVNFDGSASSDSDGSIVTYFWNFGDETYAYGATATHAYSEIGAYSVSLTVTDNRGGTDTTTKTVTVENRPIPDQNSSPVAVFTESPKPAYATGTVTFDASESYDNDGTIVSYSWNFGDGTTATGVTTTHVYADDGSYVVELTVTDNDGATDSTTATKAILNNAPVASFTQTLDETIIGEENSFDASQSCDVDGTIVEYSWTFGDSTTATGVTATHSYLNSGTYTVTLTVTDDNGATDSVTSTVTVVNQAPVAAFTANTTAITENQGIQFDASASYDNDGTIASYSWNFGDGTTATGVVADHLYSAEGDYVVTLTVTDDEGATDSTTVDVTVDAEPEVTLAVLSVIGLGITALTATILYGLFVRRNKKKKSKKTY